MTIEGSQIYLVQLVLSCVCSLCCVECGIWRDCELGFRGDALFPVDEGAETDCVALEADGNDTRRPSSDETVAQRFFQQRERPITLAHRVETAVQTEVGSHITNDHCAGEHYGISIGEPAWSSPSEVHWQLLHEEQMRPMGQCACPVPFIPKHSFLEQMGGRRSRGTS